jgi:glycosyltransferase involved in cell wall biosynthesis
LESASKFTNSDILTYVSKESPDVSVLWVSFTRLDTDLHSMSVLNVLKQIVKFGDKVSLIAVQSKNPFLVREGKLTVLSVPLKGHAFFLPIIFTMFLFVYLPFYSIFSKAEVIVIDPYVDILCVFPQLIISKLKKQRIILDIRSIPVETAGFRGFLRNFWFKVSVNTAKKLFDGMTIITPLMKKDICDSYKIEPGNVGLWSSGVDTKLFDPENNYLKGIELKAKLGLSTKFVVFYHGVLTATRGLEKTLESIKLLVKKYPDVVLLFLGAGPLETKLNDLINNGQLQDNVIIHNSVDQKEVPKFISLSDACIVPLPNHPYWRSQSPLKLLEYMSMEKTIILSDIPAHRLVLGEEKCAKYISSIEPDEIAKAIEYVYLNKAVFQAYGKIGRDIVQESFTWEKVALDLQRYLLIIKSGKKANFLT